VRSAPDWDRIDLVVFDVDGTLYDAARLRRAMLQHLLVAAWRERSLRTLQVLGTFRQVREALAQEACADFLTLQYTCTAARTGCDERQVRALVQEWMQQRPLPLLQACRWPQVQAVFAGLRAAGKPVWALSDYPAADKLQALGLQVDGAVSATDAEIARLKPDPRGLQAILARTGVPAARALMVGDRFDRDAAAAQRVGMPAWILSRRDRHDAPGVRSFRGYGDPVFGPVRAIPMRAAA
jgi:phosphoglycolate phosphatase/putative hydrolase of the HAD superfamily